MEKYTVTLNTPFDVVIASKLKKEGVSCRYVTELNPYLVFVEAKNIKVLKDLDFVIKVRESQSFSLYV